MAPTPRGPQPRTQRRVRRILRTELRCLNIRPGGRMSSPTAVLPGSGHRNDASDNLAPTRRYLKSWVEIPGVAVRS